MNQRANCFDAKRLYSLNGGIQWCERRVVDVVLQQGVDALKRWAWKVRDGADGEKAAQLAEILLGDFVRNRILEGLSAVEAPLQATYRSYAEAHLKMEAASNATTEALEAWESAAQDFRSRLQALGSWAKGTAITKARNIWGGVVNDFAYVEITCAWKLLDTPEWFARHRVALYQDIDFIRDTVTDAFFAGSLEQPLGISDFETSLKGLESAQVRVESMEREEVEATADWEAARLVYDGERNRALAALRPLSKAGQWALFSLVSPIAARELRSEEVKCNWQTAPAA